MPGNNLKREGIDWIERLGYTVYILQLLCFSQLGKAIKYISCFILDLSPSFDFSLIYDIMSHMSSGSSSSLSIPRVTVPLISQSSF